MKKLASLKYKLITWGIFVVAYSAIVFIIAGNSKDGVDRSVVTTYILMMIPLIFLLISFFIDSSSKRLGAINAVNAPSTVSLMFVVLMFIITTILYFFNITKIMVFVIVVYIFLTAIFAILFALSLRQKELINETPNKIPDLVNMNNLTTYLRELFDKVVEPTTKSSLDELIEMSSIQEGYHGDSEDIAMVEKSIYEYAGYLKKNINRGEYANAYNNISKIKDLLNKRTSLIEKR